MSLEILSLKQNVNFYIYVIEFKWLIMYKYILNKGNSSG